METRALVVTMDPRHSPAFLFSTEELADTPFAPPDTRFLAGAMGGASKEGWKKTERKEGDGVKVGKSF